MRLRDGDLGFSPTDLNNFLACRHLTALDRARAHGEIKLEKRPRPDAELIAAKGAAHERASYETAKSVLSAVVEREDGSLELGAADLLHDLTPDSERVELDVDTDRADALRRYVMMRVQHPLREELQIERAREVEIRREYLGASFELSISRAHTSWQALADRVARGESEARLARDEAQRRLAVLERRRDDKLAALDNLAAVVGGPVRHLGTAVVSRVRGVDAAGMRRDVEAGAVAMRVAMEHERTQGWEPEDVSRATDGSGFDIRSFGPNEGGGRRPVRRIAVKGRSEEQGDVQLTPNEWRQAARHRESYWLYVAWDADGPEPRLLRICDPVHALAGKVEELREFRGYRIPGRVIEAKAR